MRVAAIEDPIVPDGQARQLLEVARGAGLEAGCAVWWVGGGVRDLLREATELDLDLVVEGDLEAFLGALAARSDAEVVARSRFLTAEVRLGALRLDVARARRESYPAPAVLPVVEAGTVEEDLGRRDFTINAMAISVAPEIGAQFLDPHGGRDDLRDRQLRILHPRSFEDDPTRILRALDFAARFEFALESATETKARAALAADALRRLSASRLGAAVERTLGRSRTVVAALDLAHGLGALQAVDLGLRWDGAARAALIRSLAFFGRQSGAAPSSTDCFLLALLSLFEDAPSTLGARLVRVLGLHGASALIVSGYLARCGGAMRLGPGSQASEAHRLLRGLEKVELAHLAALREDLAAWVRREIEVMRHLRLSISGEDLRRHGLVAGPVLGQALARTLDARLDGEIAAGDELEFALATAHRDRSAP